MRIIFQGVRKKLPSISFDLIGNNKLISKLFSILAQRNDDVERKNATMNDISHETK